MFDQIGGRLLEERKRLKLSQTEMGALGGVAMRTYHTYETGARYPDAECLAKFYAGGVDVSYVITGVRSSSDLKNDENALLVAINSVDARGRAAAIAAALAVVQAYSKTS